MEKPITCHVELLLENGEIEKMVEYLNKFDLIPGKKIVIIDMEKEIKIKTLPQ